MEYEPFDRLEKKILGSDTGGIRFRFEWGHLVLRNPELAQSDGRLKHGAIDKLIVKAVAKGSKLSRREVKYRVQLAKTYPTEPQIGHVCAQFEDWSSLRTAGFPAVEAPEDAEPYDPRPLHHKRDDAERELKRAAENPELYGQETLFLPGISGDNYGPESALQQLWKCHDVLCELNEEMYARGSADAAERLAKLTRLTAAVGGDRTATWAAATEALNARGE